MRLTVLLLASAASAQLHDLAVKAGLQYFGAATDSPGERERAGLDAQYPRYDQVLREEFGQTTPTNGQKWLFTEPYEGVFNYTEGEITSAVAANNSQLLRCHTLVWHSQLAPWVEAKDWTAETLTAALVRHVSTVAAHWRGRCAHWDVVNEALNEDGTYRQSVFYRVLGEEYIRLAFREAAKADPEAKLYYNDYNLERVGPKSEGARRIVRMLKQAGIKVDGIGMQAHLIAHNAPGLDAQIAVIKSYAEEGVEVALTELDVRLNLPANETNLAQQKEVYKNSVGACVQVEACVGITLWDFYDPFSWVPYVFDGQGAPLLWFDDWTKHPAYDGVVEALTNVTKKCKTKRRRSRIEGAAVLE